MRIEFTYSPADLEEMLRPPGCARRLRGGLAGWVGWGSFAVIAISLLAWLGVEAHWERGWVLHILRSRVLVIAGMLVLGAILDAAARRHKHRARDPIWEQAQTLEIDQDSVRVWNSLTAMRWGWPLFTGCWETPNLIVLAMRSSRLAIPKRAVPDLDQLEQLRAIIRSCFQGPSRGFPVLQTEKSKAA